MFSALVYLGLLMAGVLVVLAADSIEPARYGHIVGNRRFVPAVIVGTASLLTLSARSCRRALVVVLLVVFAFLFISLEVRIEPPQGPTISVPRTRMIPLL